MTVPFLRASQLLLLTLVSVVGLRPVGLAVGASLFFTGLALATGYVTRHAVPTWKSQMGNTALLLGSLLFIAVALELGCRVFIDDNKQWFTLCRPHPTALYDLTPDFDGTIRVKLQDGVTRPMTVRVSSQGLRDRFYGKKEAGEFRVLMLGDSFTFGWGVAAENTIPACLEAELRARHPERKITVINAGVHGYGPWQSHIRLKERGLALEADLVIFQSYLVNDLTDSLLRTGGMFNAAESHMDWQFNFVRRLRMNHISSVRFDNWLNSHSHAIYLLNRLSGRDLLVTRLLNHVRGFPYVTIPPAPPKVDRRFHYEIHLKQWYPKLEEAWDLFTEDIVAIRDTCRANNIDFAVYNVSDPFDKANAEKTTNESHPGIYEFDKAEIRFQEFCKQNDIRFLSILEATRSHPNIGPLIYQDNGHYSELGNAFVAGLLAEQLDQGLLIYE